MPLDAAVAADQRAYSILTIKNINEDERVIEGMASTPTPDRDGDIVEPLGAQYRLPMPLLWMHRSAEPIGTVEAAKPTKDGIPFRARIPRVEEPGRLKDRIDEAWQSLKAGLVRGVSIGYRSIERAMLEETRGYRFTKWEWLELSLVTIPANEEATIHRIKSIDTELRAALGKQPGVSTRPGAAGTSQPVSLKGSQTMSTYSEQIQDAVNRRAEKAARMAAIMDAAGAKGETLEDAAQEEFDTLEGEVKRLDEHLVRLRTVEKLNSSTAKAVDGNSADGGTNSRHTGGNSPLVTSMKRNLPKGIEFTRYAMCLLTAKGMPDAALKIAENRYPDEERVINVLKAAVAAGTTTDPTWAGALTQYVDFAGDFIEYLNPGTIIGKFGNNGIPPLRSIPFNVRVKRQTSGGDAYWVGEGRPKPLTSFDFDTVTLRWAKIANIAVLTDEQVRFSSPSAETAVRSALAEAITRRQDVTFIDPTVTAIADTRPAAITNGASNYASSGTDAAAARADAGTLMTALAEASLPYSQAVWIANSATAIQLFLMRNALGQEEFPGLTAAGGTYMGRPMIVSDHIAQVGSPGASILVLMIPQEIYLSDDGQIVVDASREASLQMDDAPTNASSSGSPATPTPTTVVSMFQTNSVAIRAERYINWDRRRDEAVQYLTGVQYAA